ncbi:MAG: NAD(P)H-binding protein [Gemmatimonadota bacterium]|nr:NAD(P)H-binding protein [Gemmatimonadota bacterium]
MTASSTPSKPDASRQAESSGLVLVAGGTGFLGSAIVEQLLGHRRVVVLSRGGDRARGRLRERFGPEAVELRTGDVTAPQTLDEALADVDTVVQCVQFPGSPVEAPARGRTFLEVDAAGTRALVDGAVRAGVRKLVYLSGVGADEGSDRAWFRAKGLAERAVRESGLAFSIVRPSWTFGPGDVSLNRFVDLIKAIPFIFPQLGPGTQRINPVFVDDVGRLVRETVVGAAADGQILEIGGREVMTMDEVIRRTADALGRKRSSVHVPLDLVRFGGSILELLPGQILSRDAVDFITASAVADLTALDRIYPSFELRGFDDAIAGYLASR